MTDVEERVQRLAPIRRNPGLPPSVQAHRMQRYSIYLMIAAFLLLGANYASLTVANVTWFAAGLCAALAIVFAGGVVVLNGLAWNFDRLAEELRGGRKSQEVHL